MATRFTIVDRDTPLLLPPDMRDWVPNNHMVRFVIDAVNVLNLDSAQVNTRGTGSAQYPPSMMLGLLIYGYATGILPGKPGAEGFFDNIKVTPNK